MGIRLTRFQRNKKTAGKKAVTIAVGIAVAVIIISALIGIYFKFLKNPKPQPDKPIEIAWESSKNIKRIVGEQKQAFPLVGRIKGIESVIDEYTAIATDSAILGTGSVSQDTAAANQSLSGKVILIDPGHGDANNPGSSGPTGLSENLVVLEIAKKLKAMLEKDSAAVYLTRTAAATNLTNKQRGEYANQLNADVFIRIHADKSVDEIPQPGYVISWYKENSRDLAIVFDKYMKQTNRKSLGVYQRYSEGLEASNMPSVSVDVAKISIPEEEELLKNKEFLTETAQALYMATKAFLVNYANQ